MTTRNVSTADVSIAEVLISKVLIANRGEISRRIQRTLRQMGIASVAVFSDADRDAPHVSEADEAVHIGPAPSVESYLNIDAVISAAKAVGADAIHPGYGFLAENPELAERCEQEGLVFIGPSADAIRQMGDKAAAKAIAERVGVPTLEGFSVDGLTEDKVKARAEEMGYPLLLKATAGGGGKGMRRVGSGDELADALVSAEREAEAAFGDGSLLVEPWLESVRHVEVQVFGDAHGKVVHFFERDCSVQRRHQKVIEEAPSPAVDSELRRRMGEAAVALAQAVDYRGAGTVEFLLDAEGAFYFLEMNTRLQVEHPVTEAITGLDLVRLQLEVAQGSPLGFNTEDLEIRGHAVEVRLYAEDPTRDFLPSTGRICLWKVPVIPGVRVDSGIELGQEIGIHYDPMLAKVIASGSNRPEALRRLRRALDGLAVGGVVTNRRLLASVLAHESFERGEADTGFLEANPPQDGLDEKTDEQTDAQVAELHAIAATLRLVHLRRGLPSPIPSGLPTAWRNNRWRPQEQIFIDGERCWVVLYQPCDQEDGGFQVQAFAVEPSQLSPSLGIDPLVDPERPTRRARYIPGDDIRGDDIRENDVGDDGPEWVIEIDGVRRRFAIAVETIGSASPKQRHWIHGLGRTSSWIEAPRFPEQRGAETAGGCLAPMTGKIIEVPVQVGDLVSAGDSLVVLEAMKMEHRLTAHADGRVTAVRVEVGQMVDPDEVMVVVEALEETA